MAESGRYEKLRRVVQRNEECRIAFWNLKSQIRIGLMEAREVFESLSAPLMRLVGIKEGEMSDKGRSSSVVFVPPDILAGSRLANAAADWNSPFPVVNRSNHQRSDDFVVQVGMHHPIFDSNFSRNRSFSDSQHQKRSDDDEPSYTTARLLSVCEELKESQDHHIRRIINLLRTTEFHVKTRHSSILETLDTHHASLHHFLQKSTSFLSSLPRTSPSTSNLTSRILRAVYNHSVSGLYAVSDDVESLLECLTEQMCAPMVAHVKKLREDMDSVKEMEAALVAATVEVERAKKRARIADEEKAEALRLYKEYEEKFHGMKKIVLALGSISELQNQSAVITKPAVQQLRLIQQSEGGRMPVARSSTRTTPSPLSAKACGRRRATTRKRNCTDHSPTVR